MIELNLARSDYLQVKSGSYEVLDPPLVEYTVTAAVSTAECETPPETIEQ